MPIDKKIKELEQITLHNSYFEAECDEYGCSHRRSREHLEGIIEVLSPGASHRLENIGNFINKKLYEAHRELKRHDRGNE